MQSFFRKRASCVASRSRVQYPVSLLCLIVLASALVSAAPSAWAQNPFNIDGNIPDAGAEPFSDPFGSVQELGPVNGANTKISVVHSAVKPMLSFTNPNGQTDLVTIWLDTAEDASGDTWLYFAWQRDANSGSSVITYEFQHAEFPAGCDYTGAVDWVMPISADETGLIANCNPWSARQADDFLIVWDFKGGATDIILRTFDGMEFDVDVLDDTVSDAELNPDTSRGEGAVNLSDTVFETGTCTSIGSVITGTVTGNSDSADYKDTVFADVVDQLTVSNCGVVRIRKETDPNGEAGSFSFTHNLEFVPANPADTGFILSDNGVKTYTSVAAPGSGYYVDESDPGPDFVLTDIDCSASDDTVSISSTVLADGRVTFDLDRGETLDCTFTNGRKPAVKVRKELIPSGDGGLFDLLIAGNAEVEDATHDSESDWVALDIGATPIVSELAGSGTSLVEYVSSVACDNGQSADPATSLQLSALDPGDRVTCTFTNTRKPRVRVAKALIPTDDAGRFDLYIDAGLAYNEAGHGNTSDWVSFDVGDTPTVSEQSGESTSLASYASSVSCDNGQSADPATSLQLNALAAGDEVTCTFTNALQEGAIRILKTRKYAAAADDAEFDGDANDEPHPGVTFTVIGGLLGAPAELVTDGDGEACIGGLIYGNYTVTETVPEGYTSDDDEKTVTVDQVGTCEGGGEEMVTFANTPLSDVTISVAAQDPDATRSRINCYQATMEGGEITLGDPIAENEVFADDITVDLDDQLPGYPDSMIVCTIEIDP